MADLVDISGWLDLQGINPAASSYIKGADFSDWDWDKAIAGGYSDDEINDTMRRAWRVFRNENPDFPLTTNPPPAYQSRRFGDWKAAQLERRGRRSDASWGDVQIGIRTCTVRAGLDIDSVSNKILNALNSWTNLQESLFQDRERLATRYRMISNAVKSIIEDDISPNLGDDTTFYYALEHFQRLVQRQARAYTILARAERLDGLAPDDDDFIPDLWDLVKQAERLRIDNVESTYPRWSRGGSWIGDELLSLYPTYEGSYGQGIGDTVIDQISELHDVQSNLVQNHVRNAVWRYLDQVLDIEITRNRTFEGNRLTEWLGEGQVNQLGQVYWWRLPRRAARRERVEAAIRDMFGDLSGYRQSRILEYTGAKEWFDISEDLARHNFRTGISTDRSPASRGSRFSWVQRNVELIHPEIPGPTSTGAWVLNDRVSLYEIWEERGPGFNLVALETLIEAMRRFRWWTDSLEDRLRLRFDEGIEELRQFAGGATISQRSDTLADVLARTVLYEDRPTLLTAEELARASDLEINRAAQAVLLERGEPEYLVSYLSRDQKIELITLRPAEFDARTVVRPATEFSPEIEGTPLEVAKFQAAEHAGRSATEAAEVQMRWQPPFVLEMLDADLDTLLVGHGPVTAETAVLVEEAMPAIDDLIDALVDSRGSLRRPVISLRPEAERGTFPADTPDEVRRLVEESVPDSGVVRVYRGAEDYGSAERGHYWTTDLTAAANYAHKAGDGVVVSAHLTSGVGRRLPADGNLGSIHGYEILFDADYVVGVDTILRGTSQFDGVWIRNLGDLEDVRRLGRIDPDSDDIRIIPPDRDFEFEDFRFPWEGSIREGFLEFDVEDGDFLVGVEVTEEGGGWLVRATRYGPDDQEVLIDSDFVEGFVEVEDLVADRLRNVLDLDLYPRPSYLVREDLAPGSIWYWTEEGRLVNRIQQGARTKIVFDPNVGPDHLPRVIEEPTVLAVHASGGRILSPVMIRWMDAIWTELPNMAEWQARRVLRWLDDPGTDDAFRSMLAGFTYGDPGVRGRLFGGGLPIGTKPTSMSRFLGEPDVFFPPVPRSGLAEEALDLGAYPFTRDEGDIHLQRFIQQRIDAGYLTEDIRRLAVTLSREIAENASTPYTDALRRRRVGLMDALLETPPHIDFAGIRWTNPASDGAVLRIWRQASAYGFVDDLPADPSWDRQVWEMVRERIENGTMSAGLAGVVEDWLVISGADEDTVIRKWDLGRMQVMEALTSRKVIPADKPESIFYGSTQDVVRTWLEPASDHLLATVRRGLPDVGDVDRRIPPFVLNAGDRVLVDELVRRIESGNLTSGQASAAIRWKTAKLTGNEDVIADATDLLAESLSKGRPRPMAEALAQRTEVEQGTSAIAPWTGIIEPGPSADRLRPPVPKLGGVPQWSVPETWVPHPNPPSLGGITSKIFYQDANGDTWMIKGGGSNQPGEAEFAAHTLSYMVGVDQPPTVLLRVPEDFAAPGGFTDTRTVVAFRLWTAEGGSLDILSYSIYGQADQNASPAQLAQLLENFAIDSFIGNTDTHTSNFLLVRSGPAAGRILGIDKGFAFSTDIIFQRGPRAVPIGPVYSNIFESYRIGDIDLDWDVLGRIVERIGDVTDEQIRIIWRPFVEQVVAKGRVIDSGSVSQPRARTVQAQLQAIVDRKNNFRDDVEAFVNDRINARRIRTSNHDIPDWVPQWKRREVISPIDEVFVEEIRTVGTAGKAVIVNSPEIHSGVIKFDIVTNQLGEEAIRGHVQFRDSASLEAFRQRLLTDRKFRTDNFEFVAEPKMFYQSSRVSMDPVPGKTNELLSVRSPYDNPDYSRPRHGNANTPDHGDFETGVIARTVDGVEINGVFTTEGIAETFKGQFEFLVSPSGRFTSKILTQSEILDWKPVAEMDARLVLAARDAGRTSFFDVVFDRGEIDITEVAGRVNMRFIRDASIPDPVPGTVSEEDFDYWMTAWQGYGREVAARIAHGLGWRSIPEGFIMSSMVASPSQGRLQTFLWRNFFNDLATDGFEDWRFISPSTGLRDARATVFAQRDYRAEFGEDQVSRFEDLFDDITRWRFAESVSEEQRREINKQVVQHQILSWFLGARKQGNYEDWLYVRDPVSGQNFMVDQDFQPFFSGFGPGARTNPGDIDRVTLGEREGNAFRYLWDAFEGDLGVLSESDIREIREYVLDIQNMYRKGEEWQDTLRRYGLLMAQVRDAPEGFDFTPLFVGLEDSLEELSPELFVSIRGAGSVEKGLEDRIDLAYSRMADFLADELAEQELVSSVGISVITELALDRIFVPQFDPDQVTVADLQRILDTIENRLGFNLELLTQDARDELYWALNLGQEIVNTGGASEVVRRAQDGLAQLTTDEPGPKIEAIRDAFVAGKVLAEFEEVDTTPYYPHLITGEEFGKPIFARPNPVFLDEQGVPILYDIALVHRLGYLSRNADFWWLGRHGGAGSEVLSSQLDRIEWGTFIEPRFQDAAYHDRYVGGASSVYAQVFPLVNPPSNLFDFSDGGMVFMNPARQYLKYNTYTSNADTDGATALRPQRHGRTPLEWREKNLGTYGRETMIRGSVTLFDDIEILISDEDEVRRLIQWARDQGVDTIRGVPITERWVWVERGQVRRVTPISAGIAEEEFEDLVEDLATEAGFSVSGRSVRVPERHEILFQELEGLDDEDIVEELVGTVVSARTEREVWLAVTQEVDPGEARRLRGPGVTLEEVRFAGESNLSILGLRPLYTTTEAASFEVRFLDTRGSPIEVFRGTDRSEAYLAAYDFLGQRIATSPEDYVREFFRKYVNYNPRSL